MAMIFAMIINYCDIDQDKYHILSSYALHSFKPIGDLDVCMNEKEWLRLKKCKLGKAGIYKWSNIRGHFKSWMG